MHAPSKEQYPHPLSSSTPTHPPCPPPSNTRCSYVPFLASIFNIVPLSWEEWQLVILWSAPVVLIDEVLKLLARLFFGVKKIKTD